MITGHDRTHGDDPYSYQTNQIYPGSYPGQGGFGASSQRSNFSSSGPSHMFSPGQSSSQVEENSGDPTGWCSIFCFNLFFCFNTLQIEKAAKHLAVVQYNY